MESEVHKQCGEGGGGKRERGGWGGGKPPAGLMGSTGPPRPVGSETQPGRYKPDPPTQPSRDPFGGLCVHTHESVIDIGIGIGVGMFLPVSAG